MWLRALARACGIPPRQRERHPIADAPDLPVERRVHLLECHLAQLWDQVWWDQLPWRQRWYYRYVEGHRRPIREFYSPYYSDDVNRG